MAAATASPGGAICLNCEVFGWPREEGGVRKHCSRCKVATYCGKACQVEHWASVHQKHCRYLAEPGRARRSVHRPDCSTCRQAAATGEEGLEASPLYGCVAKSFPEEPPSLLSPHPFPLEGESGDRQEGAAILLMKFLAKMAAVRHPISSLLPAEVEELRAALVSYRRRIWCTRKIFPDNHRGRDVGARPIYDRVKDIRDMIARAGTIVTDHDTLDLWALFEVVLEGLRGLNSMANQLHLQSPLVSIPKEHHHLVTKAAEGGFLQLFDELLALLSTQLVPYSEVVQLVAGGEGQRSCTVCRRIVTVEEVVASERPGAAYVTMWPTAVGLVFCNQDTCFDSMLVKDVERNQWTIAVWAVSNAVQCDNCFKMVPVKAIHRCSSCLTKQYCSPACLHADFEAGHRGDLCRREGEQRKVKGGKRAQVEKGKEESREAVNYLLEQAKMQGGEDDVIKMVESFKIDKGGKRGGVPKKKGSGGGAPLPEVD